MLTVSIGGTGNGRITVEPAGTACGDRCWEFEEGTAVTITATPAGVSTFEGWIGEGCQGRGACSVTLSGTTNIGATFSATGEWIELLDHAPFSPRDTGEDVVFAGRMWLSHGWGPGEPSLTPDVWVTSDGRQWDRVAQDTPYDPYSELVEFDGKLWAIKDSVWNSVDGVTWTRVAEHTPFGVRAYGEVVVHDGRMWQLGSGADVWSSTDGIQWDRVTAQAPFGNRYASAVATYGGYIWLLGGATQVPNVPAEQHYRDITTRNDVWRSSDGANWTKVTDGAQWAPRMWSAVREYAGALWIIGGFDNRHDANFNDVWYSEDGVYWLPFVVASTFEARHEVSSYVYDGSLWVVAGNTWPVTNDVWRLTLPALPVAQRLLTIRRTGDGGGDVVAAPSGVSCGSGCIAAAVDAEMTLTAVPAAGSRFAGWSGTCSGLGTCTITLSDHLEVVAQFAANRYVPMDVDGNGTSDLVWHLPGGEVVAWLMNGRVKIAAVSLGAMPASWTLAGIGDFDGDHKSDVVWQDRSTGASRIWFMDGTVRRATSDLERVADTAWQIVAVADLDGDEHGDLVWRHREFGDNYVWFMDGATRRGGEPLEAVADTAWIIAGAADFDGDTHADLLWRNVRTGDNYIWLMRGVSRLGGRALEPVADANWGVSAIVDVDNDGDADVHWHNAATGGNYVWFMHDGSRIGGDDVESLPPPLAAIYWRHDASGEVRAWFVNGSRLAASVPLAVLDRSWEPVVTGDFNRDGQSDLLWRNRSTGETYVWFMNGVNRIGGAWLPSETDPSERVVGAGDFDGDGETDILWRNVETGGNRVWLMVGSYRAAAVAIEPVPDRAWTICAAADIDGDGDPDIAWRNTATGENYVWYMDGTRRLSGGWMEAVADPAWTIASVRDMDRDGRVDLIWRHSVSGDNYVWFMAGTIRLGGAWLPAVPDLAWVIFN